MSHGTSVAEPGASLYPVVLIFPCHPLLEKTHSTSFNPGSHTGTVTGLQLLKLTLFLQRTPLHSGCFPGQQASHSWVCHACGLMLLLPRAAVHRCLDIRMLLGITSSSNPVSLIFVSSSAVPPEAHETQDEVEDSGQWPVHTSSV